MTDEDNDIWFPAKRYGWGWGFPITWQGWVVLLGYLVLLALGVNEFLRAPNLMFFAYLALITVGLIAICYQKGEAPRWRWGEGDDEA